MRRVARPREIATTDPAEIPACVAGRLCSVWLPIETASALNARGSTKWRGARDARVRGKVASIVRPAFEIARVRAPCTIVLVRVSSGSLDSDNLWGSQKKVRDAVADVLGVDDADASVTWAVDQIKAARGVRGVVVEVYPPASCVEALRAQSDGWWRRHGHAMDVALPLLRRRA